MDEDDKGWPLKRDKLPFFFAAKKMFSHWIKGSRRHGINGTKYSSAPGLQRRIQGFFFVSIVDGCNRVFRRHYEMSRAFFFNLASLSLHQTPFVLIVMELRIILNDRK